MALCDIWVSSLSWPLHKEMQSQPSSDYRKLSSTSWCPVVGSWQPGCGSDSCSSSCWRPRGLSQDIVDDVLASFNIELKGEKREREMSVLSQVCGWERIPRNWEVC